MDTIWRWAISISLLTFILQLIPGFGVLSVRDSVMVALVITLLNAGLKPALPWLKIPYTIAIYLLALLILNAIIFWVFLTIVPVVYMVDTTSALTVLGLTSIVGWFIHSIPPLDHDEHKPKRKKIFA